MSVFPEIFCDLNSRMTENGYLLTAGSYQDLANLGLTVEAAVGKQFTFNGGDDSLEGKDQVEIIFNGTIERDEKWGYLAVSDPEGVHWRPKT